ncbi:MAG: hypothetical protein V4438_04075 [Patescibacteria group bacterium]
MKVIPLIICAFASVLASCTSTKVASIATPASSESPSVKQASAPIDLSEPKVLKVFKDPNTGRTYKFIENGTGVAIIEEFETEYEGQFGNEKLVAHTMNVLSPKKPVPNVIYTNELCHFREGESVYYSLIHYPQGGLVDLNLSNTSSD